MADKTVDKTHCYKTAMIVLWVPVGEMKWRCCLTPIKTGHVTLRLFVHRRSKLSVHTRFIASPAKRLILPQRTSQIRNIWSHNDDDFDDDDDDLCNVCVCVCVCVCTDILQNEYCSRRWVVTCRVTWRGHWIAKSRQLSVTSTLDLNLVHTSTPTRQDGVRGELGMHALDYVDCVSVCRSI